MTTTSLGWPSIRRLFAKLHEKRRWQGVVGNSQHAFLFASWKFGNTLQTRSLEKHPIWCDHRSETKGLLPRMMPLGFKIPGGFITWKCKLKAGQLFCYFGTERLFMVGSILKSLFLITGVVGMVPSETKMLFDFSKTPVAGPWYVVNDGVMGGLSQSDLESRDGFAAFRGDVSLDNNGGFASIRGELPEVDLAGFDGFQIRVKGDGKTYKLRLRTSGRFDGVAYSANFTTVADEWQSITLATQDFVPMWRGRVVARAPALEIIDVRQLGILISDKQVGPFELKIEHIQAYREDKKA